MPENICYLIEELVEMRNKSDMLKHENGITGSHVQWSQCCEIETLYRQRTLMISN